MPSATVNTAAVAKPGLRGLDPGFRPAEGSPHFRLCSRLREAESTRLMHGGHREAVDGSCAAIPAPDDSADSRCNAGCQSCASACRLFEEDLTDRRLLGGPIADAL